MQPKREKAYRWAGGRKISQRGYAFVYVDGRYIQEHRLVAEQTLGRPLRRGEIVHHLNHDKLDNRPENLAVMTQGEHARHHIEIDTWTREHPACVGCGTTERRHAGQGLCQRCYGRQGKPPDTFQPFLTGRWSRRYDRCQGCGTVDRRHICRGLCRLCYERQRGRSWKVKPEKPAGADPVSRFP